MRTPDLVLFFGYIVVVLAIGFAVRRREATASEFFLISSKARWFPKDSGQGDRATWCLSMSVMHPWSTRKIRIPEIRKYFIIC